MKYDPEKYKIWERYKLFRAKALAQTKSTEELEAQIFEKFVKGNENKTIPVQD